MRFETALDAMKAGAKVKRPSWAGYWSWDEKKETFRMHCRPEESDIMQQMLTWTPESEKKCVNKPNIAIYALS